MKPPNIVYIAGAGGLGLVYQSFLVLIARARSVPTFFHHHSSRYLSGTYLPASALRLACGRWAEHIALSQFMASQIKRRFAQPSKIHVWSNASHVQMSCANEPPAGLPVPVDEETIRFGHLSNLSMAKGLRDVTDVLQVALEQGLEATLTIAGPTTGAEERELIRATQDRFGSRFTYSGPLNGVEVEGFMASLDIFLFPSTYLHESEPMVILEAAAVGVPTIAIRMPGVEEVVVSLGGVVLGSEAPFSTAAVKAALQLRSHERRIVVSNAFRARRSESLRRISDSLRAYS